MKSCSMLSSVSQSLCTNSCTPRSSGLIVIIIAFEVIIKFCLSQASTKLPVIIFTSSCCLHNVSWLQISALNLVVLIFLLTVGFFIYRLTPVVITSLDSVSFLVVLLPSVNTKGLHYRLHCTMVFIHPMFWVLANRLHVHQGTKHKKPILGASQSCYTVGSGLRTPGDMVIMMTLMKDYESSSIFKISSRNT